jgi:MoaA/NifB/PqqE/SkfB family radical SAM enzyme
MVMLLKNNRVMPTTLRLDATTICQLACPSCPTASGQIGQSLGSQHLSFEIFKNLLENNPLIRHIELSNWGELFLNPKLEEMIKLTFEKGVHLTASNGVNVNFIKPAVIDAMVKFKFHHIVCSIDGATQEVYEQYRIKGKIASVFENIGKINALKVRYDSLYPRLTWQFIVFKHNFHEIPLAKEKAKSLNMNIVFKLSWDPKLAPDQEHSEWIKEQTGLSASSRSEHQIVNNEVYKQKGICSQLWKSPQLNSDGRVLGCCVNTWGDFGTYKSGKLSELLNNEKMMYTRNMLMGKVPERVDIPCTSCGNYKAMKKTDDWMTKEDIGISQPD